MIFYWTLFSCESDVAKNDEDITNQMEDPVSLISFNLIRTLRKYWDWVLNAPRKKKHMLQWLITNNALLSIIIIAPEQFQGEYKFCIAAWVPLPRKQIALALTEEEEYPLPGELCS